MRRVCPHAPTLTRRTSLLPGDTAEAAWWTAARLTVQLHTLHDAPFTDHIGANQQHHVTSLHYEVCIIVVLWLLWVVFLQLL